MKYLKFDNYMKLQKQIREENPGMKAQEVNKKSSEIWKQIKAAKKDPEFMKSVENDTGTGIKEGEDFKEVLEPTIESPPEINPDAITFESKEAFAAEVAKIVREMGIQKPAPELRKAAPNDFLDTPAIFFTYDFSHTCFADRRNGQLILPPEQAIRFEHSFRYPHGSGSTKDARMVNLSIFKTYSQAEADWIKEHSMFGIRYFEEIKNANADDAIQAQAMVNIANGVNRMSTHQLIERAKALPDVTVVSDIPNLRLQVVQSLTAIEMSNLRKRSMNIVKETAKVVEEVGFSPKTE